MCIFHGITLLSRENINIHTSTYHNALIIIFCFLFYPRKQGHVVLVGSGHADLVNVSLSY